MKLLIVILLLPLTGCLSGRVIDHVTPATVHQFKELTKVVKLNAQHTAEVAKQALLESGIAMRTALHANSISMDPSMFEVLADGVRDYATHGLVGSIVTLMSGLGLYQHKRKNKQIVEAGNQHPDDYNSK